MYIDVGYNLLQLACEQVIELQGSFKYGLLCAGPLMRRWFD